MSLAAHLFWGQTIKVKFTSYKNIAGVGVGLCTLVGAGFFYSCVCVYLLCRRESVNGLLTLLVYDNLIKYYLHVFMYVPHK